MCGYYWSINKYFIFACTCMHGLLTYKCFQWADVSLSILFSHRIWWLFDLTMCQTYSVIVQPDNMVYPILWLIGQGHSVILTVISSLNCKPVHSLTRNLFLWDFTLHLPSASNHFTSTLIYRFFSPLV